MSLTYAGYPLGLLPDDYKDFIKEWHSFDDFLEADLWGYSAYGIDHLPLPSVPIEMMPTVGSLVWPTSFSRCAYAHYLVDSTNLALIDTTLGTGNGPANLVITDGLGNTLTVPMYFLAARPLSQIPGFTQCFLLTLVDIRYHYRTITGSITSIPASWSALFTSLASGLGITLTPDTINSNYSTPTSRWVVYEKPLGVLLDSVCNAIGHKVVANLDGTFKTVSYTTASTAANTQTSTLVKTAGGLIRNSDLNRPVPATIKGNFRTTTSDVIPYTITQTLAGLALSGYGSATGVAGQTTTVNAELQYTGSNATACANYLTQAATDYYNWQLINVDLTYPGIVWTPSGAEDRVEWKYYVDKILTRVLRGPFQRLPFGGFEGTADAPLLLVEQTDGTNPVYDVTTLKFDQAAGFVVSSPVVNVANVTLTGGGSLSGGTPNSVTQYQASGNGIQSTPQFITYPNSGIGTLVTQYVLPSLTSNPTTAPIIQYQIDTTTATPTIKQFQLTNGTSGLNGNQSQLTPTQFQITNTLSSQTGTQTYTPGGTYLNNVLKNYVTQFQISDSGTTNTVIPFQLGHSTSGTPAANFGVNQQFVLDSTTTASRTAAELIAQWVVATDASRRAQLTFNVWDTVARTAFQMVSSGSAAQIGFLGASVVAQQTGDAGSALTAFGLMSGTPTFGAANLTGTTLASSVVTSSLTSVGTLTGGATGAGFTVALSTSTITGTLPTANLTPFNTITTGTISATDTLPFYSASSTANRSGSIFDLGAALTTPAVTTYSTFGTYTFTPNKTGNYTIECWGAGASSLSGGGSAIGGSGGGEYRSSIVALTAGTDYTLTVGKGGTGGNGGTSSFNTSSVIANGGISGTPGGGGAGGSGGTGTTGHNGGAGAAASGSNGGGGGSSGGSSAVGNNGSGSTGGAAPTGGGAGGNGGTTGNGANGSSPGGGAGGDGSTGAGTPIGADGQVKITFAQALATVAASGSASDLTTGTLPIARGGTNSGTSLTNNQLMYSNAGAIQELGAMTNGQIVVGKTSNAPQIVTLSGSGCTATMSNAGVLTLSAIANSTLTNSSITTATNYGLTGTGAVSLGSTQTLSVSLSQQNNTTGSNFTVTTTLTSVGASISLVAGTWLIWCEGCLLSQLSDGTNVVYQFQIWNSTDSANVLLERVAQYPSGSPFSTFHTLIAVTVPSSTKTYQMRANYSTDGTTFVNNLVAAGASIGAVRIAA